MGSGVAVRAFGALLGSVVLAAAGSAAAQPATTLNVQGGALTDALLQLSQQAGVELVFDRDVTAGKQAPPVRGRLTPEAGLQRLLADSGLVLRRSPSGLFVVERPAAPPLARQDVTVPEILVIGRRSQNADIRRLETDIQPYRVATGLQIRQADRENLDAYFASRVPSNTTTVRPSLDFGGATNSQIDLRGLGPNSTLVLIDGRRMPGVPGQIQGFLQPDLNAVPLPAIERVEILTGAAGGIYGYGAQGGVVNVVLARGLTGVELNATGGVTSRGDARQFALGGRIGTSLNDGRTDVMLFAAASRAEPLLKGQRDFVAQQAKLDAERTQPQSLRASTGAVFVNSADGAPLVFKPAYGGGTLSSSFSFLPAGSSGDPSVVAQLLTRNAGRFDGDLSTAMAASQIDSTPRTAAVLANVRHRFDGGVEAYVDAVMLWNRGRYRWRQDNTSASLSPASQLNPFTTAVWIDYPIEAGGGERTTRFESTRFTAGVVAPLPRDWRATAEAAIGSARYGFFERTMTYGFPTGSNPPPLSPFGDWAAFQAALVPGLRTTFQAWAIINHFRDLSVRLAGPVFQTAHGPAMLTLLAERTVESVPAYESLTLSGANSFWATIPSRRTTTASLYGELRSPVFGDQAPTALLRNLEVQLAVRGDRQADVFPRDPWTEASERLHARFTDASFTAGAKISPTDWLTLRASYATSAAPPPVRELLEGVSTSRVRDPKRGGSWSNFVPWKYGGSADLQSVRVNTASFGAILGPFGADGPRLTVDYSRIRKTRELFSADTGAIIQYEDLWPQRVTRGPLTDADRALGYTAGPILALDARKDNSARAEYDMIDARLDWRLPLLNGSLRLYGDGAYYLREQNITPIDPGVNTIGYYLYPLAQRANVGADWAFGSVTVGANLQYFGSYRIIAQPKGQNSRLTELATAIQGGGRVHSQTYVDLHLSWRDQLLLAGAAQDVRIDLGVINVFDKAPPRESSLAVGLETSGYSRYGDPRQRRFVLSVSAGF